MSKSALRHAIFHNDLRQVALLCQTNPHEVNLAGTDGYTPLSDALFYNAIQCLELLHAAGVDYAIGWDGKSPLYWAMLYSQENILCFLLSAPKLTPDDDCRRMMAMLAAGKSRLEVILAELIVMRES